MKQKQKPLSFSLHPLNHSYIESVVSKQKETNHRYNRSMYMDDLITHLRTKAKPKETQPVILDNPEKPSRFTPPSFDEVCMYMTERGVSDQSEAASFGDFYESNGWKVGKNKMKCWKASVRNWLKGYKEKSGVKGKTSGNFSACEDFING